MTRARDELHLTVPLTIGHCLKQKWVARSEFINDIRALRGVRRERGGGKMSEALVPVVGG